MNQNRLCVINYIASLALLLIFIFSQYTVVAILSFYTLIVAGHARREAMWDVMAK